MQELHEGCTLDDGRFVADGEALNSSNPCEHCYCMKNEMLCVIQECQAPSQHCIPFPTKPDQCCPEQYDCNEDPSTDIFKELLSTPKLQFSSIFDSSTEATHSTLQEAIKGLPKKDILDENSDFNEELSFKKTSTNVSPETSVSEIKPTEDIRESSKETTFVPFEKINNQFSVKGKKPTTTKNPQLNDGNLLKDHPTEIDASNSYNVENKITHFNVKGKRPVLGKPIFQNGIPGEKPVDRIPGEVVYSCELFIPVLLSVTEIKHVPISEPVTDLSSTSDNLTTTTETPIVKVTESSSATTETSIAFSDSFVSTTILVKHTEPSVIQTEPLVTDTEPLVTDTEPSVPHTEPLYVFKVHSSVAPSTQSTASELFETSSKDSFVETTVLLKKQSPELSAESSDTVHKTSDAFSVPTDASTEPLDTVYKSSDAFAASTKTSTETTDTVYKASDAFAVSTDASTEPPATIYRSSDAFSLSIDTSTEPSVTVYKSSDAFTVSTDTSTEPTDAVYESSDAFVESSDDSTKRPDAYTEDSVATTKISVSSGIFLAESTETLVSSTKRSDASTKHAVTESSFPSFILAETSNISGISIVETSASLTETSYPLTKSPVTSTFPVYPLNADTFNKTPEPSAASSVPSVKFAENSVTSTIPSSTETSVASTESNLSSTDTSIHVFNATFGESLPVPSSTNHAPCNLISTETNTYDEYKLDSEYSFSSVKVPIFSSTKENDYTENKDEDKLDSEYSFTSVKVPIFSSTEENDYTVNKDEDKLVNEYSFTPVKVPIFSSTEENDYTENKGKQFFLIKSQR
nr:flocculation protein FLO11-like [Parasteatoda tepidariorum]